MEKIIVKVSSHKEISRKVLSTDGQSATVRYNNQTITVHHVTCYGKYSNEAWLSEEMYQDFLQNGDPWLNSLLAGCEVSTKPVEKKATILDREVVSDHYVVYICLSSDGVTKYRTTLVDGIATGCTCPARAGCYHKTTCQAQERFEIAWNAPIEPAQVWSQNDEGTHVVESIEEGEFEIEAAAIIAIEKRKAFENVCAEVRKIEQRGRRERAALGPQERKVEQGPSGAMVLMRAS